MRIILGSQSPRRRELMAGLDIPFTAISIDADETYPADLQAGDIPYYISRAKARAYEPHLADDELLITADTIVWLDGHMLGKPHDETEAVAMLRALSGKTHQVITGVCLTTTREQRRLSVVSDVTFKSLTEEEISYYVDHYRPYDKAGAYGIQEWIGYIGVTRLSGSYFNVVGFPVQRVYQELVQMCGTDMFIRGDKARP